MRVKEESEKAGLKLNIKKTKIMASDPITSWQIDGVTMETERLSGSSLLSAIRVVSSALSEVVDISSNNLDSSL